MDPQGNLSPVVSVRGLSKFFGSNQVLKQISFDIVPGITGLLGPNGAGKSTFIKILLGVEKPTQGYVGFVKDDRTGEPISIGYMSESKSLIPSMAGLDFVAYAGELEGMPRKDALRRSNELLDCLGLSEARFRAVGEYSAGMVQKMKLAQALVHDPDFLVLDEPTAALDPPAREQMLSYLRFFADEHEKSILLSTHLLDDVREICNHMVVLNHGNCLVSGPMHDLLIMSEGMMAVEVSPASLELKSQLGTQIGNGKYLITSHVLPLFLQEVIAAGGLARKWGPHSTSLEDFFVLLVENPGKTVFK